MKVDRSHKFMAFMVCFCHLSVIFVLSAGIEVHCTCIASL